MIYTIVYTFDIVLDYIFIAGTFDTEFVFIFSNSEL